MTIYVSSPETYIKLCKLMEESNSNIEEFSQVVSFDPNLTNSVLKIVNSEFFGLTGKIDNISRAVSLLGIGQLFSMVLDAFEMSLIGMPEDHPHLAHNMLHIGCKAVEMMIPAPQF
jgi:HD-like signal output (HDOD) protein